MHAAFAVLFFAIIVALYIISNDAVVNLVYKLVAYTYGPLLGMFFFGMFTKYDVIDRAAPYIAVASPALCFAVNWTTSALFGFDLGFSLLILNGALTAFALWLFRKR